MPKVRGVIGAVLKATRPEGMTVGERRRRDRLLPLAVLAGLSAVLLEVAVISYITGDWPSDVLGVAAVSLIYFPPMLLAVSPFFALYRRATSRVARAVTIAAGSVLLPSLSVLVIMLLVFLPVALIFGLMHDPRDVALRTIQGMLVWSAFDVLPALTVFLIISSSEFFRRGKGDSGAAVPVSVSPPAVDRTQTSGGVEFSTPRIARV